MNSRDQELSKLIVATWTKVKAAVDAANPQELLALGFPDDEYDDVVGYLVRPIARGGQVDPIALQDWFRSVYGGEGHPEAVEKLVEAVNSLSRTLTGTAG
jgi:hypothetical protein